MKTFSHPDPGAQLSPGTVFPGQVLTAPDPASVKGLRELWLASTVVCAPFLFQLRRLLFKRKASHRPFMQTSMGTRSLPSDVALDSFGKDWGLLQHSLKASGKAGTPRCMVTPQSRVQRSNPTFEAGHRRFAGLQAVASSVVKQSGSKTNGVEKRLSTFKDRLPFPPEPLRV